MKKSFKTTFAGVLGGLLIALGPNVGARLQGDAAAPPVTLQNILPALAVAALGILSKDHDRKD